MIEITDGLILDESQHHIIKKLNAILKKRNSRNGIFDLFTKEDVSGLYLYGSVGTGKTMIAKLFHASNQNSIYKHYQEFMQYVHQNLNKMNDVGKHEALEKIARQIATKCKILVIDEFEINDIADAMLIGKLFVEIGKQKVFILVTSNTQPDNLYKDGLQRDSFLNFIDYINQNFEILDINSKKDYRLAKLSKRPKILYPLSQENSVIMDETIDQLIGNHSLSQKTLKVFGRDITFKSCYGPILLSNFGELCSDNLSYNDYIEICKNFQIIIVRNVPMLNDDSINEVIRFINLIDNIYFYRIKLFMTLESEPSLMYSGSKKALEFRRTISRINEMQSDNY